MGEVSYPLVLGFLFLLLIVAAFQGSWEYFQADPRGLEISAAGFGRAGYGLLAAFTGIGLLPFALEHVEKTGSASKPVVFGGASGELRLGQTPGRGVSDSASSGGGESAGGSSGQV